MKVEVVDDRVFVFYVPQSPDSTELHVRCFMLDTTTSTNTRNCDGWPSAVQTLSNPQQTDHGRSIRNTFVITREVGVIGSMLLRDQMET